jgi:hypothetical protein
MMGERTVMQEALFYGFSLEDHVPADHLLRSIDRFVELDGIRQHLRPFYSETGRPMMPPSAAPHQSHPSSSRSPIPHPAGPVPTVAWPSSPTAPIT